MLQRHYSPLDRLLIRLQQGASGLHEVRRHAQAAAAAQSSANPAAALNDGLMDDDDRRHAAGLMRINHAGEVAAQALYHGQAAVARKAELRQHLLAAADEEKAHLDWCAERLAELGEKPSRLQPLWYGGSFAIGAVAGLAGDRMSLGFVAETESQVAEHLDDHLSRLPRADQRSRAVIRQMRADEVRHGNEAMALGGAELPWPIPRLMRQAAKLMKAAAYRG